MFMTQMMQPMFESVDVDPNFGGGHGLRTGNRAFTFPEHGNMEKSPLKAAISVSPPWSKVK